MKVKLRDIIEAIETADSMSRSFLDRETGEIVWISDLIMSQEEQEQLYDQLDEHGFYRLPTYWEIKESNLTSSKKIAVEWCEENELEYV